MLNLILQRSVHMSLFIYVGAVLTTLGKKNPDFPATIASDLDVGSIGPFRFVCYSRLQK